MITMEEETVGLLIKRIREGKGISQNKLSQLSGIDRAYISQLESGKRVTSISLKTARSLAEALGVKPEIFLSEDRTPVNLPAKTMDSLLDEFKQKLDSLDSRELPILGHPPCGYPLPAEEFAEGFVTILKDDLGYAKDRSGLYVLVASGSSLQDDGIEDGDRLVVDPGDKDLVEGKLYIVRTPENEVTVKHLFLSGDRVRLVPANGAYQELEFSQIEIMGRVILSGNWVKR